MNIGEALNIEEALKIVLEMAKRSVLKDSQFESDEELLKEDKKQRHALGTVEDFINDFLNKIT